MGSTQSTATGEAGGAAPAPQVPAPSAEPAKPNAATKPAAPSGPVGAAELAGKWVATCREKWVFDYANYGPRSAEFAAEGFSQFSLTCQADGTFTFQYGSLASGRGQWLKGASPNMFTGVSTVTALKGVPTASNGSQATQVLELGDDGVLKVAYTITRNYPTVSSLTVTEYITRA